MDSAAKTPHTADTLKILVCYHKPYTMPPNDDRILLPIHVGKALTDTDLHIQGDNQLNGRPCDNISDKNPSYCELTAIYWAWKNLRKLYPDVKYVGLFHYRRFFAFNESKAFYDFVSKNEDAIPDYKLNPEEIISILNSGHVIVPTKRIFPHPVYVEYSVNLVSEDYRSLKKVIDEKFHDYYSDFMRIMEYSNTTLSYNMFIMNWEDFEEYCEWLFSVLAEVEPLIPYQHYNTYQKRVFGFMAERLLDVWLSKNHKRLKFFDVYYYDKDYRTHDSKPVLCLKWFFRLCVYLKNQLTAKLLMTNVTAKVLKLLKH